MRAKIPTCPRIHMRFHCWQMNNIALSIIFTSNWPEVFLPTYFTRNTCTVNKNGQSLEIDVASHNVHVFASLEVREWKREIMSPSVVWSKHKFYPWHSNKYRILSCSIMNGLNAEKKVCSVLWLDDGDQGKSVAVAKSVLLALCFCCLFIII